MSRTDQAFPRRLVSRAAPALIVVGLVVLSLNLRPVAVSVGPLLDDIRRGVGMGATTAGLLTTLPVLCFAGFGYLAPWCARTFGVHTVVLASLVVTILGLTTRAAAGSSALFLAATVPALAGMATANVLIPSLVKRHFPHRIGTMTAVYTTALAIGLTAGSVLTVPLADATGSWRGGLASWAVPVLLAVVPWVALARRDVRPADNPPAALTAVSLVRSPLALTMALFFGLQSIQAYAVFGWLPQIFRDAGFSAATAGLLLGITTATSIPISLVLPGLAARGRHLPLVIVGLCSAYLLGYLGLILDARGAPWLWALLIGIGGGIFPLALTLISLRARTSDGTAALSGFAQSLGYLLAGGGPLMMGVLYGATGGWTVPLVVLIVLLFPQVVSGLLVSRHRFVEDELDRRSVPTPAGG
ncbi:MAG: CynX/NimT family MFS transporter [Nocardioidaceae bacterium]